MSQMTLPEVIWKCALLDVCDFDPDDDDDDYDDDWNESICRTSRKGRRIVESSFEHAMLYLRGENDKIGRIGDSIVFNSQMNERFAQRYDKQSLELIKHNAEALLNKECNELVDHLNSLISYCDDAIDTVDQK